MTAPVTAIERILSLSQSYEKTASRGAGRRDETANPVYAYAARTSTDPPTVKGAIASGRANSLRELATPASL